MKVQRLIAEERTKRANFNKFRSLIANNGTLSSNFRMPASGVLAVSSSILTNAISPMVTVKGKTINAPASPANRIHRIGFV